MIIFRPHRSYWSAILAKEFHRTRRDKPVMLLSRCPTPMRDRDGYFYGDAGQMRLHCRRWSQRRDTGDGWYDPHEPAGIIRAMKSAT